MERWWMLRLVVVMLPLAWGVLDCNPRDCVTQKSGWLIGQLIGWVISVLSLMGSNNCSVPHFLQC